MAMLLPVRLIALLLNRLPFTVSACASKIVALLPPLTGPATASAVPSFSTKLAAVKLPRFSSWLVIVVAPVRLVAPVELPDSVPAINVPVSVIVPLVAIRLVVRAGPAVADESRAGDGDAAAGQADRAAAEQAAVHRQRLRIEDRRAAAAVDRPGHRQRRAVVQHEAGRGEAAEVAEPGW